MFDFIPSSVKAALGIGAAILIGLAAWNVYLTIYDRGYQAASTHYEQLAKKQKDANDAAIASAEKDMREDLAAMKLDKEKLEDEVARLNAEAAADPDADDGALGAGSVQRLNSVR